MLRKLNNLIRINFGYSVISNNSLATVSREEPNFRKKKTIEKFFKKKKRKKIIVEVGAWEGDLSNYMDQNLNIGNYDLHLIEPLKEKINICKNKFKGKKNFYFHNFAIANNKKLNKLYKTKKTELSSLKKPKKYKSTIKKIDVVSGLQFYNLHLKKEIDVMFINTQGTEFSIVKSFREKIKKFKLIFYEFDIDKRYNNNEKFSDVLNFFEKNNFYLFDFVLIKNKKKQFTGIRIVEICFVNKNFKNEI